jgi:hypothetical protein
MKFVVTKTKSGMFENEYQVRLSIKEKTKTRLRIAVLGASILAPAAYFVANGQASPTNETDPETPASN